MSDAKNRFSALETFCYLESVKSFAISLSSEKVVSFLGKLMKVQCYLKMSKNHEDMSIRKFQEIPTMYCTISLKVHIPGKHVFLHVRKTHIHHAVLSISLSHPLHFSKLRTRAKLSKLRSGL